MTNHTREGTMQKNSSGQPIRVIDPGAKEARRAAAKK
jgi:hypothetical protein